MVMVHPRRLASARWRVQRNGKRDGADAAHGDAGLIPGRRRAISYCIPGQTNCFDASWTNIANFAWPISSWTVTDGFSALSFRDHSARHFGAARDRRAVARITSTLLPDHMMLFSNKLSAA